MADRNRYFAAGAIALPFLLLVMAGSARANGINVNTLDSGSQPYPLCTLEDAVTAANIKATVHGCSAGSGDDTIFFSVTGTIFTDNTLVVTDPQLTISGPTVGSPAGPNPPAGITINGGGEHEILEAENSSYGDFLTLQNLTFSHGFTTIEGAAVLASGTLLTIENSTFESNTATLYGGAIFGGVGEIVITNSTFSGNGATYGGAIYYTGTSTLILTNSTFSGNSAIPSGGGGLVSSSSLLKGTILANNTGGNCFSGGIGDAKYNISSDATCAFNPADSKNNTDPLLDPTGLQNNGGPTETIALESGSPARSFDTDCTDQEATPQPVLTDQRLYGRPNSPSKCDSGAYEFDTVAPFVLVPNTERLQVSRGSSANSDQINLALTFQENGTPTCQSDQDALNAGLGLEVFPGTCETINLSDDVLSAGLNFVAHTVNHQSYGTSVQQTPPVSARIVTLEQKSGGLCGEWTLNLEAAGLNTTSLGSGPVALLLIAGDDSFQGCFDITNAIIGSQIPKVVIPVVRRGARR
jgi:predicted outer membrane repeat protein